MIIEKGYFQKLLGQSNTFSETSLIYSDKIKIYANIVDSTMDDFGDSFQKRSFFESLRDFFSFGRFEVLKNHLTNKRKLESLEELKAERIIKESNSKDKKKKKPSKSERSEAASKWLEIIDNEKDYFAGLTKLYESVRSD